MVLGRFWVLILERRRSFGVAAWGATNDLCVYLAVMKRRRWSRAEEGEGLMAAEGERSRLAS